MKQLLLKLDEARPQTLESFVIGHNPELVELLRLFIQRRPGSFGERAAYMWGAAGVGKSHLLHAIEADATARYINAESSINAFDFTPEVTMYLLDDCQNFDDQQQIAAFNLFNQVKEQHCFFIATGTLPPALLTVREDFRTRLGWGLIYQLQGLTDSDKIAALERFAVTQGVTVPDGVLPYLITHYRRDMSSLSQILNALINHSLEIKRPITLPFVREVMLEQKVANAK
ncbi:DnaA family protein [Oxalobacteraceae bacterium GrIS 2.11]